jgi:hypothetical protein
MNTTMAAGKKSFLFYSDWMETFKTLPKDKGYDLLMHILQYVNDENPETDDVLVKAVFSQIKNTLKRDLEKWDSMKDDRSYNGRMGNLKRYNPAIYKEVIAGKLTIEEAENLAKSRKVSPSEISDRERSQDLANVAVNDSVSVSVNDSVIVNENKKDINYNIDVDSIYYAYPSTCPVNGTSTGKTTKNKTKIRQLLKSNTADHLRAVIERYVSECKKSNRYMKNFTTFLNNIPDYEAQNEPEKSREDVIVFRWKHDPSHIERKVKREEAVNFFENQAQGGYYPVML